MSESSPPALVVMAAGAGSRFGGAKQMTPIGPHGEWLLEFALFDAHRAGFRSVACIIRDEHEGEFRSRLARVRQHLEAQYVFQRADDLPAGVSAAPQSKPWGTGHAVWAARAIGDTPFAVVNADDFYGAEAYRLAADACRLARTENIATIVGMRLDQTLSPHGPVTRAWCQTAGDLVTRIEEVTQVQRQGERLSGSAGDAPVSFVGTELVSMNFWVFPPSLFQELGERFQAFLARHAGNKTAEFLLPDVVNDLIQEGRLAVRAVEAPGPWFGLTYREDREATAAGLAELARAGVYSHPLWGTL